MPHQIWLGETTLQHAHFPFKELSGLSNLQTVKCANFHRLHYRQALCMLVLHSSVPHHFSKSSAALKDNDLITSIMLLRANESRVSVWHRIITGDRLTVPPRLGRVVVM